MLAGRKEYRYYGIMLKEKSIVVRKSKPRPQRKRMSAISSHILTRLKLPLIDIKESIQLAINNRVVKEVNSSIKVSCDIFNILIDVNTTKQRPRRFDDALRICGDFVFGLFID
ncbi:MAG: hypothetical protein WC756_00610 [Taibaiella sp.]|jgi:hypothetical protein